jgi:hypothetical protein
MKFRKFEKVDFVAGMRGGLRASAETSFWLKSAFGSVGSARSFTSPSLEQPTTRNVPSRGPRLFGSHEPAPSAPAPVEAGNEAVLHRTTINCTGAACIIHRRFRLGTSWGWEKFLRARDIARVIGDLDLSGAGDEQGLHVRAARHLRVRRVKALAQFSLRHKIAGKKEGVFQGVRLAESDVEKGIAEIGPRGLVLASKRCMVSIRCGDDKCISICEARNEDARIAGRNDYDLMSHARLIEHLTESGWLKDFSSPSRCDSKTVGGAVGRKDEKQNVTLTIHLFCLIIQCCCERFDSRTAALFCIESYNNRPMPESASYNLRCASRLASKNPLIAE